jgi:hypothetical protein
MFRVIIRPDGHNPLTGRKQYRVLRCQHDSTFTSAFNGFVDTFMDYKIDSLVMVMKTDKRYQPNSFINPRKALNI